MDKPTERQYFVSIPNGELLEFACVLARNAGDILTQLFGTPLHVRSKGNNPGDFVTAADIAAERAVRSAISSRFPTHAIIAEEEGVSRGSSPFTWLIDPLDGTTNYIRRIPVFGVSIGLLKDGEPLLAVIFNPITDELFHAVSGEGSYRNGQRVQASRVSDIAGALIGVESGKTGDSILAAAKQVARLAGRSPKLRNLGSSAISLAMVGSGVCDGFIVNDVRPWDTLPGTLFASEGGAIVRQMQRGDSLMGTIDWLVASNPSIHEELLEITQSSTGRPSLSPSCDPL